MQDDEFATETPSEPDTAAAPDAAEVELDEMDEPTRPMRMDEVFDDE